MNAKREVSRSSMDRLALVGAAALGLALCAPSVGKVAVSGQWLTPAGVLGTALGAVALVLVGGRLLGKKLPYVASDRAALVALVVIAAVKFALAAVLLPAM